MLNILPPDIPHELIVAQTSLILSSYKKWTGKDLIPPTETGGKLPRMDSVQPQELEELAYKLFKAPFVLVASNNAEDPMLTYGNQRGLALWEMSWATLTKTLGRHTAEPMHQTDRQKFLDHVQKMGFIDNYSGIRISSRGRRFKIERATVWNLIDEAGNYCGQAAAFIHWQYLQ